MPGHYQRHGANGPWYILSPAFALPHARPDEGVLSPHSVLSLLCCAEAVAFPEHPGIRLIIVLAAADSEQHIQTIQRLVCWLDEGISCSGSPGCKIRASLMRSSLAH
jgi:mannitol/fructose-specific phosphotransferase system IIA component (Ntr-type)